MIARKAIELALAAVQARVGIPLPDSAREAITAEVLETLDNLYWKKDALAAADKAGADAAATVTDTASADAILRGGS